MNILKQFSYKINSTIALVFSIIAFCILLNGSVMAAGLKDQACGAAGTAGITSCSSAGSNDAAAKSFVGKISRNILNGFSLIIGAVGVIMIVVGGLRYVISSGDSGAVKGAKDTIIYALVGLVIALFAQVIARFVLSKV